VQQTSEVDLCWKKL